MPSKLQKAIGAVKDQTSIGLAKVSTNSSSNLEVAVLRATTHDDVPIDDKYVNEVLRLVSSNKFQAAACARAIGKRIGRTRNWVVALKSLMLVLRIFQDGDPYFPREVLHAMKRGAHILNLASFRDDSNSSPWDFTAFVRTFAIYLDERLECFLTGKLQRRYTQGGNSIHQRTRSRGVRRLTETVRDMKPSMLLDKISYWQRLLERAIATRPTGAAKMNRLIQICFYAIVQESFELYKDISDGLALLLDSFFHLQYQNCVSAFQACVKAVKQYEELNAFYTLCKSLGIGRSSEYPSVQTINEELIETLQEFLKDQTSFPSNGKVMNRIPLLPAPKPNRTDSPSRKSDISRKSNGYTDRMSDFGTQCTSLEDLISATETGMVHPPAISIDLEAYSASHPDDSFRISDTGSTRSLPVSNSMADLMSLYDWTEMDDSQEKQKRSLDSSLSKNWELQLTETISTPTSSSQTPSHNSSNTNGWELVLFDAVPLQQPNVQQPTMQNNHYNPFLQDELPILPHQQFPTPSPTFQATPTFSVQNPNQSLFPVQNENENDPFGVFSGAKMLSSSTDQQNLMQEQQLWLHNQNKIIGKHIV